RRVVRKGTPTSSQIPPPVPSPGRSLASPAYHQKPGPERTSRAGPRGGPVSGPAGRRGSWLALIAFYQDRRAHGAGAETPRDPVHGLLGLAPSDRPVTERQLRDHVRDRDQAAGPHPDQPQPGPVVQAGR